MKYLNPVNKIPAKIRNVDKEFAKQLEHEGIKFLVYQNPNIQKQKKQKNNSINVFGYEDETPYCIYTSKQTFEQHIDLLPLLSSKNNHCFN